jgi:glycosyltransferase involved in cell wall biosynthesis
MCVERRAARDFTMPWRLAKLLRKWRVEVLHTHNWATLADGIVAARLARIPILVHGEHGRVWDRFHQKIVQRWGWHRVHQLLTVSAELADRISAEIRFPRGKIQVISNGVECDKFLPPDAPKHVNRQRIGLPTGGFVVGVSARMVPFKDHAGVLRAIARLRSLGLDVHLALAGSGPLEMNLRQQARELQIEDHVHFVGVLRPVSPFLHSIDALVSNSAYWEGMSNSILEAMSCALPVIATRVAAGPELLDGGRAGILVPPRDSHRLADAIAQLASSQDLCRKLGDAGRQRALSIYNLDTMIENYRQLYLKLTTRMQSCTQSLSRETPR